MIVTGCMTAAVDQYNALENIPLTDVVCYFFYPVFSRLDENVVLGSLGRNQHSFEKNAIKKTKLIDFSLRWYFGKPVYSPPPYLVCCCFFSLIRHRRHRVAVPDSPGHNYDGNVLLRKTYTSNYCVAGRIAQAAQVHWTCIG